VPNKRDDTPAIIAARDAELHAAEDEYRRLLYVGMTRAADRLIACGSIGEMKMPPGCWYELIEQGLEATGQLIEQQADFGEGTVRRYQKFDADAATGAAAIEPQTVTVPDWLAKPVQAETRPQTVSPSHSFERSAPTAAVATERRRALARGTHVHRLMQSLPSIPPPQRAEATRRYLARQNLDEAERTEIAEHTLRLIGDLRFDALFLPGSRAEVSIVGRVGKDRVSGQVDRLVVRPDEVLIADYKTNRPAPKSLAEAKAQHPAYVKQLALYRAVLMRLYPGKPVRAALLWTDTLDLMEIPSDHLNAALAELVSA
jgi:ATP-dependent helicase/nuclease subunit A